IVARGQSGQTSDLIQLQDSTGNINGAFGATGAALTLGRASNVTGQIVLANSGSANTVTLQSAAQTVGSTTLTIPDLAGTNGTICIQSSTACGFESTTG